MIKDADVLRPTPLVAHRKVADVMLIVAPTEHRLITLNETGTAVWERLDGRSVQQIIADLSQLFDVEMEKLRDDVLVFLSDMLSRRLVEQD